MCVKHTLQGFTHFLKGQCVKWYTDNKGVATIVKSESNKVHLQKLAMEIFSLSKEHDIVIDMEWIPQSDNEVADYLSKIVDFDDWGVKDSYICLRCLVCTHFSSSLPFTRCQSSVNLWGSFYGS